MIDYRELVARLDLEDVGDPTFGILIVARPGGDGDRVHLAPPFPDGAVEGRCALSTANDTDDDVSLDSHIAMLEGALTVLRLKRTRRAPANRAPADRAPASHASPR